MPKDETPDFNDVVKSGKDFDKAQRGQRSGNDALDAFMDEVGKLDDEPYDPKTKKAEKGKKSNVTPLRPRKR